MVSKRYGSDFSPSKVSPMAFMNPPSAYWTFCRAVTITFMSSAISLRMKSLNSALTGIQSRGCKS